ncbi:STAS domain-containing protein [Streptomyces neyagawaensis]|uniref:STAS domain-containing protein n=1 Tax=Streptomyces neyagawaensis TaxID=42238 RepID=UPI0006E1B119|nr:STAS domain-containing protein [Streptomyces neyagawaensis]MCL6731553.1 STAS domain-containing protein [Streptomyces neyagawaensis]MDE1683109.1 STAS domain-containing protein [Streptomyces neyagawaensis]
MDENDTGSAPYRTHRTSGGATVVTLRGEIDVVTAPALAARLDALTSRPHPDLVLDLRPVDFIDCSGLGVLCRARNRARDQHGRLRLVTDDSGFLRLLRCTGLTDVFEVGSRLPGEPAGPVPAAAR